MFSESADKVYFVSFSPSALLYKPYALPYLVVEENRTLLTFSKILLSFAVSLYGSFVFWLRSVMILYLCPLSSITWHFFSSSSSTSKTALSWCYSASWNSRSLSFVSSIEDVFFIIYGTIGVAH